ncbi:MAG TPA: hypothetical protein VFE58_04665 [Tepidisphaeraceae bacterium]|jgi:hypothetical protein|nr:hypothetical protein [Tepidisphaeraceae bacterium]
MSKMMMAAALAGFAISTHAYAVVLYDGSAPGSPASQGWLSHYSIPTGGTETVGTGETTYDSGPSNSEHGGYSNDSIVGSPVNASFPTLDRTAGFTVTASLQELSESHASNDRSGLSLIALSSDSYGIELEFWPNEIWAQSGPAFTHAEGIAYNTLAANVTYALNITGSNYILFADGNSILTGALRNYSSFGYPYTLQNYLYLGDDTGSAQGAFELSGLAVAVPEPTMIGLLVTPLLLLKQRRRSHKRTV